MRYYKITENYHQNNAKKDLKKMTDEKIKKDVCAAYVRTKKRKRRARSLFLRRLLSALFAVLVSFLFTGAEFPFATYPLGLALVCASEKYVICAVIGVFLRLAVSYSSAELYLPAVFCVSAAAFRYFFYANARRGKGEMFPREADFFERLSVRDEIVWRAGAAVVAGTVWAIVRALSGGTFYDLFGGVFCALAVVFFTFLFSFANDMRFKNTGAASAGKAALVFCAVFSLSGVSVLTLSLGVIAAYAITLAVSFSGDGAKAAVAGLLVGLAAGGENAVLFAFAGLAAGIFYDLSPIVGALVSLGVTICGSLYSQGLSAMLSFLPEILIAAVVVTTAAKLDVLPHISFGESRAHGELRLHELLAKKRDEETETRAERRAAMLSSLSQTIKNMSEFFKVPDKGRVSDMCREVFAVHCANCPKAGECRKTQASEGEIVDSIAARIMKKGRTGKNEDVLRFGCVKKDEIVSAINERAAKMFEESVRQDKTRIFAFDYGAAAKIIADTVAKSETSYAVNKELTERLSRAFENAGILAENLVVCGERKKYIIAAGHDILRSGVGAQDVRTLCAAVCGGSFTLPAYALDGANASMTLESTRLFEVEYAGRQSAKKGEKVCGDAVGVTESPEDFFYGFICDGMGSGKEADITAGICKTFLTQMLSCGNKKSTTLEMLNMFISNKNTECFSTVDLLEVDLMRGVASFTKSGAAASYIVRRGNVYKIASGTMPIGILPEVSAEVTEFSLCDGDVIVMCSDGVCQDPEFCDDENGTRLVEFLEHEWRLDAVKMADAIISDAAYVNKKSDDMSVCVYKVKRKK